MPARVKAGSGMEMGTGMAILALVPLVVLSAAALAAAGVLNVRLVNEWPSDTRRVVLAGVIGAGLVLYLHHGMHHVAVSPDGRLRAGVRYNGLLLRAGIEDAEVIVEGVGHDGAFVAARERLPRAYGYPARLAWHPDGRHVACIQRDRDGSPHCAVVRIMPRLAVLPRERPGIVGP